MASGIQGRSSVALGLAESIAQAVSARAGLPCWIRDEPGRVAGDVDAVLVGMNCEDRPRVIGVVNDLGVHLTTAWIDERGGATMLAGASGAGGDVPTTVAERIAELVATQWFRRVPLSALDAGVAMFDAVRKHLSLETGHWRLGVFGQWEQTAGRGGMTIDIGGDNPWESMSWCLQARDHVDVKWPAAGFEQPSGGCELRSLQDLMARWPNIAQGLIDALAARDRFRSRPWPLATAASAVLAAVRAVDHGGGSLRLDQQQGSGFPKAWPSAMIWRFDAIGQHRCVMLEETASGITVTAGKHHVIVGDAQALARALPDITAAVMSDLGRLTPDKLRPGAWYRLRVAFAGAATGERVRFDRCHCVPYDGIDLYHFERDGGAWLLHGGDPEHCAALAELDRFLEPESWG